MTTRKQLEDALTTAHAHAKEATKQVEVVMALFRQTLLEHGEEEYERGYDDGYDTCWEHYQ